MVDVVEAALDVPLNDPWIRQPGPVTIAVALARLDRRPDILQGAVRASSGPEPLGDPPELRLEDWLQKYFDGALHDAILDRGDAQGPELPRFTGFRDEFASRRAGPVCAGAQFGLQLFEKAIFAPFPDTTHGHPVDASCSSTFVRGDASPGVAQRARIG